MRIISADRIATCNGDAVDDGAIALAGGRVEAVGPRAEIAARFAGAETWTHRGLITPGLVDAHTHAVWIGSRAREYAMRMAGADYEAIAAAGGGIASSMHAVREASVDALTDALAGRLSRMAAMGVTTVEVKSGYGLSEEAERRQLEAVRRVAQRSDLPAVVATYLGMHAVPPEAESRDAYAVSCTRWLDGVAADRLARFADAYIDRSAFSVAQARPYLTRARDLGLALRVHVGQFADVGGAELCAELGAKSVDHVENISLEGARALAEAGVSVVLLPIASWTLDQAPPPIALFREHGINMAVASDSNPGTAPSESLPLAMSLAVRSYGLSVDEMLRGATVCAARTLDLDCGVLAPGSPADIVLWDLPHEADLAQPWGVPKTRAVLRAGQVIAGDGASV